MKDFANFFFFFEKSVLNSNNESVKMWYSLASYAINSFGNKAK